MHRLPRTSLGSSSNRAPPPRGSSHRVLPEDSGLSQAPIEASSSSRTYTMELGCPAPPSIELRPKRPTTAAQRLRQLRPMAQPLNFSRVAAPLVKAPPGKREKSFTEVLKGHNLLPRSPPSRPRQAQPKESCRLPEIRPDAQPGRLMSKRTQLEPLTVKTFTQPPTLSVTRTGMMPAISQGNTSLTGANTEEQKKKEKKEKNHHQTLVSSSSRTYTMQHGCPAPPSKDQPPRRPTTAARRLRQLQQTAQPCLFISAVRSRANTEEQTPKKK